MFLESTIHCKGIALGFIYVFIVVIGITSVAYLAMLSARKGVSSFDLSFTMFLTAVILGCLLVLENAVPLSAYTIDLCFIAIVAGVGGSIAVFIFNHALRIGHFGFTNAIYRSSFLMPVVFGLLYFGLKLDIAYATGILAILTSIFLISWSNDAFSKTQNNLKWFLLSVCAFTFSGLPRIGQLLVSQYRFNPLAYLFASYVCGFILLLFTLIIRRQRIKKEALWYGTLASLASYTGVYFTIEALKLLPASVVFPITLSTPVMLGMMISLLYRERIRWTGWFGIIIGIGGILILSFQTYQH